MSIVEKNIDLLFDRIAELETQIRAVPRSTDHGRDIEALSQKVESLKSALLDEQARSAASLGQVKQAVDQATPISYFRDQMKQAVEALVEQMLKTDKRLDGTIGVAAKDAATAAEAAQSITKAAATQLVSEMDRLCRGGNIYV